ncbi:hypothetical protein ACIQ57_13505 [Lysinibacillus xylanilyticus]
MFNHDADTSIGDRDGMTPLQRARKLGFHEIRQHINKSWSRK